MEAENREAWDSVLMVTSIITVIIARKGFSWMFFRNTAKKGWIGNSNSWYLSCTAQEKDSPSRSLVLTSTTLNSYQRITRKRSHLQDMQTMKMIGNKRNLLSIIFWWEKRSLLSTTLAFILKTRVVSSFSYQDTFKNLMMKRCRDEIFPLSGATFFLRYKLFH